MRTIDADALKAEWYRLNNIDEEDRGARFVGYQEIPRLIDNAPTAEIKTLPSADAVPQSEQYKKGFEDAKRAFLVEYARESENMRKRNAQLEVMLNAYRATARPQGEWEHWGSPFSDESEVIDTIVCSVCGARFIEPKDEPKGEYNYCPNCGARMYREESEVKP